MIWRAVIIIIKLEFFSRCFCLILETLKLLSHHQGWFVNSLGQCWSINSTPLRSWYITSWKWLIILMIWRNRCACWVSTVATILITTIIKKRCCWSLPTIWVFVIHFTACSIKLRRKLMLYNWSLQAWVRFNYLHILRWHVATRNRWILDVFWFCNGTAILVIWAIRCLILLIVYHRLWCVIV